MYQADVTAFQLVEVARSDMLKHSQVVLGVKERFVGLVGS
jgi:hypothetical protein